MKKLVLGFVIAVSLMMGIAGAAGATGPDNHACAGANAGSAAPTALTVLVDTLGCENHR